MADITVSSYKVRRTMDPASRPSLKKCCWSETNLENRIDTLHDDVLISTISCLNLKEVARTSVLSRRWRYLWTHTTGILDFAESIPNCDTIRSKRKRSKQNILNPSKLRLIDWVDPVLNLHQGSTIDEFKVCFHISGICSDMINRWIKFALEKRVKRLLLDFRHYENSPSYAKLTLRARVFTNRPLGSLTYLHLRNVDMTGKVLRVFLSGSPLLQVLYLNSVSSLKRLKITGSSRSLRCLKIKHCLSLRLLEVHAVNNLVSFSYRGPMIKIFFKEVPRLVEASINRVFLFENIHEYSSYFSRLESLTLDLKEWDLKSLMVIRIPILPKFEKLKCLKLSCSGMKLKVYTRMCFHLLNASPMLQRIVLKVYSILKNEDTTDVMIPLETTLNNRHKQVKVMEVRGFRGYSKDVELTLSVIAMISGLETLVIDPYPISPLVKWDTEKAVSRAQRMKKKLLPKGIKLVVASHQNNNSGSDSVAS